MINNRENVYAERAVKFTLAVLCAGVNTPSKWLSDSSSVTDSGQFGIKISNLGLSLHHSCLQLFTNAPIHRFDFISSNHIT